MSECVVRMEMPENCQRCELFVICTGKYKNEVVRFDGQNIDKKDRRCLFICSIPEGHGRLIDWDAFERAGFKLCRKTSEWRAELGTPTNESYVVPAERSKTCLG